MVEYNFKDDHLSSMTTEDIICALRLLDNEMRVLELQDLVASFGNWDCNILNTKDLNLVPQIAAIVRLGFEHSRGRKQLRMREEYIEGIVESPKIKEESIPQQLKGAFDQANSTVQQLLVSIRDAAMSGFKVPLGGMFQRLFLISYLDDEILILELNPKEEAE